LGGFEQHVRKFERAWFFDAKRQGERKFSQAKPATPGRASGAAKNYPRQDPQKLRGILNQ